jgi:hypothetical protein
MSKRRPGSYLGGGTVLIPEIDFARPKKAKKPKTDG